MGVLGLSYSHWFTWWLVAFVDEWMGTAEVSKAVGEERDMSRQSRESLRETVEVEKEKRQEMWMRRRKTAEDQMERFEHELKVLLVRHNASIHTFRTSTGHAYVALTVPMSADPSIQVDLERANAEEGLVRRVRV